MSTVLISGLSMNSHALSKFVSALISEYGPDRTVSGKVAWELKPSVSAEDANKEVSPDDLLYYGVYINKKLVSRKKIRGFIAGWKACYRAFIWHLPPFDINAPVNPAPPIYKPGHTPPVITPLNTEAVSHIPGIPESGFDDSDIINAACRAGEAEVERVAKEKKKKRKWLCCQCGQTYIRKNATPTNRCLTCIANNDVPPNVKKEKKNKSKH